MTRAESTCKTNMIASAGKRKEALLNKFLSKTYHMIDQCDPSIASWSSLGDSFTVNDIVTFEKIVLPKYFNHSKFPSFIRQLNFYGFQKMRSDPDLQTHSNTVRFRHEFFRHGQPELLHCIQRTTAKTTDSLPSDQVDDLKAEVANLNLKLEDMAGQMDKKLAAVADAMHQDYLCRVNQMEATYKGMIRSLLVQQQQQQQQPVHPVHQKSMLNRDFASYMHSTRESV